MRIVTLFFLLFSSVIVYAKEETCYSIELESVRYTDKNFAILNQTSYPQACKIMRIDSILSVRCECDLRYAEVKHKLSQYKKIRSKAIVVKTYKKRFVTQKRKDDKSGEELRLMLNSFLYTNDVENAYKVATLGYQKFPNSLFWLQKSIETALWSSHVYEAFNYQKELYFKVKDEKLLNKLILDGIKLSQYDAIEAFVIQKFQQNPSRKNSELLILVEYNRDKPTKAAELLQKSFQKDNKRVYLLNYLLKIYRDIGDKKKIHKIISLIENRKLFNQENILLVSHYYYTQHDIRNAYNVLLHFSNNSIEDPSYYRSLSDFGWYLNDFKNAVKASDYLIKHQQERAIDYSRVLEFYRDKKRKYIAEIAKQAYLKYKSPYYFFFYSNIMLELGKYTELDKFLFLLKKEHHTIIKSAQYWLIKAKLAKYENNLQQATMFVLKALKYANHDIDIFQSVVWMLIDIGDYKKAKDILFEYEQGNELSAHLSYLYALFYLQLHNVDQAYYYMMQALEKSIEIEHSLEFRYLQATIYQAQKKEELALLKYRDIVNYIHKHYDEQSLEANKDILSIYFAAALNLYDTEYLEEELEKYKKYLTKEAYTNISYSLASKERSLEKSHFIYNYATQKALWMQLNEALVFTNYTKIENLLQYHLSELSKEDAVNAAKKDEQLSLAQSLSFESMQSNSFSNNAYIAYLELVKSRNDSFSFTTDLYERSPLSQIGFVLRNRTYIAKNFYFYTRLDLYTNSSTNTQQLFNINKETQLIDFGIEKKFRRLDIYLHYGYKKALENYKKYGFLVQYNMTNKLKTYLNYEKSEDVQDSTYLYVAAKKDMIKMSIAYALTNSFSSNIQYQKNYFYLQNNLKIGTQNYMRVAFNKQFRSGYPDIGIGIFADNGIYKKTITNDKVFENISNTAEVLPENFYNIGTEFLYGMQNRDIYTRVWRPYFSVSPYFNSYANNFNIGLTAGYGGKVYKNDHLVFGFDYSQPANGLGDQIYRLFINYKILY